MHNGAGYAQRNAFAELAGAGKSAIGASPISHIISYNHHCLRVLTTYISYAPPYTNISSAVERKSYASGKASDKAKWKQRIKWLERMPGDGIMELAIINCELCKWNNIVPGWILERQCNGPIARRQRPGGKAIGLARIECQPGLARSPGRPAGWANKSPSPARCPAMPGADPGPGEAPECPVPRPGAGGARRAGCADYYINCI